MSLIDFTSKAQHVLTTERLTLKALDPDKISENYIGWLKDPEIYQFLETRHSEQNIETITSFVRSINESNHSWLFGIFLSDTEAHIGNIKIGPINPCHLYADLSYFIGEKKHWGKGYATEAIQAMLHFSFSELQLHRVQAGCYEKNIGSSVALTKAGFQLEGVNRAKFRDMNDQWQDGKEFAILAKDFLNR